MRAGRAYGTASSTHLAARYRAMAESCSTCRATWSGWRSWPASAAWPPAWRTRSAIRWARWAPTSTCCGTGEPIRRSPLEMRARHRADRADRAGLAGLCPTGAGRPVPGHGQADLNARGRDRGLDFLERQGLLKGPRPRARLAAGLPPRPGRRHAARAGGRQSGDQRLPGLAGGALVVGTVRRPFEPRHRGGDARPRRRRRGDRSPPLDGPARAGRDLAQADARRRCCTWPTTAPGCRRQTGSGSSIRSTPPRPRRGHRTRPRDRGPDGARRGGTVWVDRAREGGAVFKVFLPLASETDARC